MVGSHDCVLYHFCNHTSCERKLLVVSLYLFNELIICAFPNVGCFRTFQTCMKQWLGSNWATVKEHRMTYGNSNTGYVVVTFVNSLIQPVRTRLAISSDMTLEEFRQVIKFHRHGLFRFQTHASHAMETQSRFHFLRNIQLREGDSCLEIGCGVPKLSLDMAAFSKVPVMMLDVGSLASENVLLDALCVDVIYFLLVLTTYLFR